MRYARFCVPFAFTLGLAGAARAQPPDEEAPEPYEHPATPQQPYQQQQPYQAQPYQAQPYQQQQPYQTQQPYQPYQQQPPPYIEGQPQCCEEVPAQPQQARARRRRHVEQRWEHAFSPYQFALSVGGGGADFVKEGQAARVLPGAAWNARLTVGTRSFIALELSYVGSMNKLVGPFRSEPQVMSNGFESDLRLNFTRGRVQPYGFGGVG